ncbi:MAG: hypothetical protein RBT19_01455 [Tenuifilaceae bacterium]|nr:hypothetical protein [Tenuifilaceae bacterium]
MALSSPSSLSNNQRHYVPNSKLNSDISTRAYHYVNLLIGIAFAGVILYSLIYKANSHPIPALLTEATGEIPPSKGLSASFSEIVRGNFDLANAYNPFGIRIFAFFALQLLLRAFFSIVVMLKRNGAVSIILTDSIVSTLLFAYCFWPLIVYTLRQITQLIQHL